MEEQEEEEAGVTTASVLTTTSAATTVTDTTREAKHEPLGQLQPFLQAAFPHLIVNAVRNMMSAGGGDGCKEEASEQEAIEISPTLRRFKAHFPVPNAVWRALLYPDVGGDNVILAFVVLGRRVTHEKIFARDSALADAVCNHLSAEAEMMAVLDRSRLCQGVEFSAVAARNKLSSYVDCVGRTEVKRSTQCVLLMNAGSDVDGEMCCSFCQQLCNPPAKKTRRTLPKVQISDVEDDWELDDYVQEDEEEEENDAFEPEINFEEEEEEIGSNDEMDIKV